MAIKCTNGIYANIDGTWHRWVGAPTDGVVSATKGQGATKWHPAKIEKLDPKDWLSGWTYIDTSNSSSASSIIATTINDAVKTPILGYSYQDNGDGTVTKDGKVYGYTR